VCPGLAKLQQPLLLLLLAAGRLADMASQMGVSQATGPLGDLSKGVSSMANMLGAQVCVVLLVGWVSAVLGFCVAGGHAGQSC
jgi:hypothetical protein